MKLMEQLLADSNQDDGKKRPTRSKFTNNTIQVLKSSAADVIIREVHDWELDVLTDGEQSDWKNLSFACLGIAFGLVQNAISLLVDAQASRPITLSQIFLSAVFVATLAIGVVSWIFARKQGSTSVSKKIEIRARELSVR